MRACIRASLVKYATHVSNIIILFSEKKKDFEEPANNFRYFQGLEFPRVFFSIILSLAQPCNLLERLQSKKNHINSNLKIYKYSATER